MMQITREDLNPCTIQLQVTCSPEQVKEGFSKALKYYAKRLKIPGFRPGQAPRAMIENMIDPRELTEHAADEIAHLTVKLALDQENIKPHETPYVTIKEMNKENSICELIIKVPLAPIIELSQYKGLSVDQPKIEVSDQEVEELLDNLRKQKGKRAPVMSRGALEGDVAVVNVKTEDEKVEGRNFMTVIGKTFSALDEALIGMQIDDIKNLELSFPENFHEKDWAGKTHQCHLTIRSLNAVELPELNDEFARSLQEEKWQDLKSESIDDLRSKLRQKMLEARERMSKDLLAERLLRDLAQSSTVHVADNTWENVASRRIRDIQHEAQKQEKSFEEFAKGKGMTSEAFIEAIKEEAKEQVIHALIASEIFKIEELKLTQDDLNQALQRMSIEYEIEPRQLYEMLKKEEQTGEIQFRAIFNKVMAFLIENANIKGKEAVLAQS